MSSFRYRGWNPRLSMHCDKGSLYRTLEEAKSQATFYGYDIVVYEKLVRPPSGRENWEIVEGQEPDPEEISRIFLRDDP